MQRLPRGHRRRRERHDRARPGRSGHRLRRPRRRARPAHAARRRSSIPTLAYPRPSTARPGRCRSPSRGAIRSVLYFARPAALPHRRRRRALDADQPRPDARGPGRARQPRRPPPPPTTPRRRAAPRRHLRDRAVAPGRRGALGRHRRRPDLAHAGRGRALEQRHAAGAHAVVEGRRSSRPRTSTPRPPTPRSTATASTTIRPTSTAPTTAARTGRESADRHPATATSSTSCARTRCGAACSTPAPRRGVYVSFDDGDHWQPLQRTCPCTSVRDIDVHGDDLVIATHGRALLDPRRRDAAAPDGRAGRGSGRTCSRRRPPSACARPASPARRLPKDEPMAAEPPDGRDTSTMRCPRPRGSRDADHPRRTGNLVRRYSSTDLKSLRPVQARVRARVGATAGGARDPPGMHRFVWDLRYSSPEPATAKQPSPTASGHRPDDTRSS